MPKLRVVFLGTPDIAVPTLERLLEGPHDVVGVVSQPDRERGRGRKPSPSPVSTVALREGLPLIRPERIGDEESVEALRALAPDIGVVVAFGQFLPKKVRTLPTRGYLINAHASLLPRYRGASPIAQAILEGQAETGVCVMRVEREMDAGPVALVERTPIGEGENTAELSIRLSEIAATAIARALDQIADDAIEWTDQDEARATIAPKLEKADAVLDLTRPASELVRRIHALSPKPGGSLRLAEPAASEEILKVSRATSLPFSDFESPEPGISEQDVSGVRLRIATSEGWLVPLVLQRAGGRALPVEDFLRGYSLEKGARFSLPSPATPEPR